MIVYIKCKKSSQPVIVTIIAITVWPYIIFLNNQYHNVTLGAAVYSCVDSRRYQMVNSVRTWEMALTHSFWQPGLCEWPLFVPGSSFHMKSVLPCGPGLAERLPVCVTKECGQNGYSDQDRHFKGSLEVWEFFSLNCNKRDPARETERHKKWEHMTSGYADARG